MTNNKGITLIALVITIIVLLILAGVSIAMLTGQNGILTQATNAGDKTSVAEVVERVNMELQAQYANALAGDSFDDKATIEKNIGTVDGFTITATVTQASDGTTGSVQIAVTGDDASKLDPATGKVEYVSDQWKLTPIDVKADDSE